MLIFFVYYVLRTIWLTVIMILQIPKQLVVGFYTGLRDTGMVNAETHQRVTVMAQNLPQDSGLKEIFIDSIVELFHTFDSSDEDQPGVTGMPSNRNASYTSDSGTNEIFFVI